MVKKSISVIAPPEDINLLLRKNEKYYIVVRLLAVHQVSLGKSVSRCSVNFFRRFIYHFGLFPFLSTNFVHCKYNIFIFCSI